MVLSAAMTIGNSLTHPIFFVALFKWIFLQGWRYPFYSAFCVSLTSFLIALAFFFFRLYLYASPNREVSFLPGPSLAFFSFLHTSYLLCTVLSLYQDSMSAASFLMLMVAADMLFTTILSSLVLRRSVSRSHWISVAFVIIAFVMYEFV